MKKEEFINKAKKIHGDKYDYSKVNYFNDYTKVCIICPEHGEFWQTPYKHINNKQGCSQCNREKNNEMYVSTLFDGYDNLIYFKGICLRNERIL